MRYTTAFLQGTVITQIIDLVNNLHNVVLQILLGYISTKYIDIGHNLTKLLQKLHRPPFIPTC